MPTYIFENIETGEITEEFMKMDERKQYLKTHPKLRQILNAPAIVRGVDGVRRVASGFRDLLKSIKKGSPRSNVNIDR